MADSLLDMGSIAQFAQNNMRNAISLAQLDQRGQELELDQQRMAHAQQQANRQWFRDVYAVVSDPRLAGNTKIIDEGYALLGKIGGFPELTAESVSLSREALKNLYSKAMSHDPVQANDAYIDLAVRVQHPEDLKNILSGVENLAKVRADVEKVIAHKQVAEEKYNKLASSTAQINVGREFYPRVSLDFLNELQPTRSKEFTDTLKTIQKLTPKGMGDTQQIEKMHGGKALPQLLGKQSEKTLALATQKKMEYLELADVSQRQLNADASGVNKLSYAEKAELQHRVAAGLEISDAYGKLAAWAERPFNRGALQAAQQASQAIEGKRLGLDKMQAENRAMALQLKQDAFSLRQSVEERKAARDDVKDAYERNIDKAQRYVLEKYGYTPNEKQLAEASAKFNVRPEEVLVRDPSKTGRLEVGIVKMGQEDMSRQFKAIESAQTTIDYIGELRDVIKENPALVGRPGQLGTAMAGASQQLRAIVGRDPAAAKFLNTKPRDNAEALYEVLVYAQAKTMDPAGALDLKVVDAARRAIGDLNSFTTGPEQMLNKLDLVERQASKTIRRARQRIVGGVESYKQDQADKPFSKMTEEELGQELMRELMGGKAP